MRIKLQSLAEHIHGFLLILAITAVLSCMIFPLEYQFYFWHSFLIVIPFAVTAWGQKKQKHLVSYLITGSACAVFLFFLGTNFLEKLYLLILSVLIMLIRIPPRLNKTDDYEIVDENVIDSNGLLDSPSAGFLGFFVLLFLVAALLKRSELQNYIYWITFAWIADFLMYINLKSLNSYLYSRRGIANLPGQQIISTNRALMLIFSALAFVILLVLPLIPLDQIVTSIGLAIRDFLRWIFSHFSAEEQSVVETVAESLASSGQSPMLGEVKPTPAWLKMLYDILFAVISFAIGAGALVGIGYAILVLVHRFYKPASVSGDTQEFIDDETESTSLQSTPKNEKGESFFGRFHPNATIRKYFKRQIQKGHASKEKHVPIPSSLTPTELENYAGLSDEKRTHILHALYEKARYSKEGCTKEDVAILKKSEKS